jgi:uncharacterized lipoprotein YajG
MSILNFYKIFKIMDTFKTLIVLAFLTLITGCATMPPPVSVDTYREIQGAPYIGLEAIDSRDTDVVGTVGLTSFKMKSLDTFLYAQLKNELNNVGGLNIQSHSKNGTNDLRLPVTMSARIDSINFTSMDALLDDADGICSVSVMIRDANGKLVVSEKFTSNYKRKVSWPNMNGNKVIIEDLLRRVTKKIISSKRVRTALSY